MLLYINKIERVKCVQLFEEISRTFKSAKGTRMQANSRVQRLQLPPFINLSAKWPLKRCAPLNKRASQLSSTPPLDCLKSCTYKTLTWKLWVAIATIRRPLSDLVSDLEYDVTAHCTTSLFFDENRNTICFFFHNCSHPFLVTAYGCW